jgi:multidrug efflux pump subunit AcrA (membrane-fusion protein)
MSWITRPLGFARTHKWKLLIAAVIIIPIGAITMFALSPNKPTYVTEVAKKQDLQQTVEAVGTVISERDLQLEFPTSGVVEQVYVKEGDTVQAGQKLAALRAGNLAAAVASASAQVQQAQANLQAMEEGSRPEDIAVSQAEVQSKQASLETAQTDYKNAQNAYQDAKDNLNALKQEAQTSLVGYVTNVGSTVTTELTSSQNALSAVQDIFASNKVVDAVIKSESPTYDTINGSLGKTSAAISALYGSANPQDFQAALDLLSKSSKAVNDALFVVNQAFDLISQLPETGNFKESDRQTYKSSLVTQRNALQGSLSSLDAETKTLKDASANFSTRISSGEASVTAAQGAMNKAQTDIATFQTSLQIAQAQLQLKQAPARSTDLAGAQATLRQMQASLARAVADYSDTILTAPIAGKITKVNVKAGERTPTDPAITMLGDSPFRVEMYVSEIDVPKVQSSQTGSIELDAFRGTKFALHVSEIDSASTDRDGVPKYRIRLDFVYPHDELKIGMTGDAAIVTGMQKDVVSVPLRAVLERDDGTKYVRVQKQDGTIEERTVETGLEGANGDVEVNGVKEGETVIVLEKK